MKLLVLDAYAPPGREALVSAGGTLAGELYAAQLCRSAARVSGNHSPTEIEIAYPADPDPKLPGGSELAAFDAAVWTGSSLSILDAGEPNVRRQLELARELTEAAVPCFGSCWAAQLAVVAAGGRCAANPRGREFGISRQVTLNAEGRAHPLFTGKPEVFDAFTSHADEVVSLPTAGTLLASNAFSRVQAIALDQPNTSFWAVQYHPEYDANEVAALCRLRAEELVAQGVFADRKRADQFAEHLDALHADPTLREIAAELGIGPAVLDERVRTREIENWLAQVVIPRTNA
jgi:GMP synthase (glutamine-hydrolysing)